MNNRIPPAGEAAAEFSSATLALQSAYYALCLAEGALTLAACAVSEAGGAYDRTWAEEAEELRSRTLKLLEQVAPRED